MKFKQRRYKFFIILLMQILIIFFLGCELGFKSKEKEETTEQPSGQPGKSDDLNMELTFNPEKLDGASTINIELKDVSSDSNMKISSAKKEKYDVMLVGPPDGENIGRMRTLTTSLTYKEGEHVWTGSFMIEPYYKPGEWQISYILKEIPEGGKIHCYIDRGINRDYFVYSKYDEDYEKEIAIPTHIKIPKPIIVQGVAVDVLAPIIKTITIDPKVISSGNMMFSIKAEDQETFTSSASGIKRISAKLLSDKLFTAEKNNYKTDQVSIQISFAYDPDHNSWKGIAPFNENHAQGKWHVDSIVLTDNAENMKRYLIDIKKSALNYVNQGKVVSDLPIINDLIKE